MRKFKALLLTMLLLLPTLTFARNSPGATSNAPDKNKVIARLLMEIDAGRELIASLEAHERALNEELSKADDASKELTQAYKDSLVELGQLRATIQFQKDMEAEREKQVVELRTELDSERSSNKKLRRENLLLKLAAGAAIYILIR